MEHQVRHHPNPMAVPSPIDWGTFEPTKRVSIWWRGTTANF